NALRAVRKPLAAPGQHRQRKQRELAIVPLHRQAVFTMRILLIVLGLVASESEVTEHVTQPSFTGRGSGRLTLLRVPEDVPLEFYTVRCTRSMPGGGAFSVTRSGEDAVPPTVDVGVTYTERESQVSFRIEAGETDFWVGDTFSFVTYQDIEAIDKLFDRWVKEYVKWIISREERERFEQLQTVAEKLGFIESFWRLRDTDPSTPENEAREEHSRRFSYAVRHFGAGIPGWATDRGKIYILLGPPSAIERNPAGRTAFERSSEVWTYNNPPNPKLPASMDIGFVDFTGTGRYEIVSASNLDILAPLRTNIGYAMSELEAIGLLRAGGTLMDQTTGLRTPIRPTQLATQQFDFQRDLREIDRVPEISLPKLAELTQARAAFPSLPLSADVAVFRTDDESALVPLTLSIPYARLTPRPAPDGYVYEADVLIQVRRAGGELVAPIEDRLEVRASAGELQSFQQSELLYEASLTLPPGSYEVQAILRDNPSGAIGQATTLLEVPELDTKGLALSTLLLANGALETGLPPSEGPRPPFQFGNLRLIPNVNKRFAPGSVLTAYLQAYGYEQDPRNGRASLRVDFFILREGRLYSKVAPSYHRPAGRTQIAIKSEISLGGFPAGAYTLLARVTDEISGQKAERSTNFAVK
ncbi:MAG: GWxTD domain-containing protein, partial [Acidobacteriota bacterium]